MDASLCAIPLLAYRCVSIGAQLVRPDATQSWICAAWLRRCMMNSTATIITTSAASPTRARRGLGSGGPLSLTCSPSPLYRQGFLSLGPFVEQRVADAKQHWPQKDPEKAERDRPTQHTQHGQQKRQLRAAGDEPGPDHRVGTRHRDNAIHREEDAPAKVPG